MKAVVFDGRLRFRADHPAPEPSAGEALIRVAVSGICSTDIEITRGYAGMRGVLGHEFVGHVSSINGPEKALKGARVTGEINIGCSRCPLCLAGGRNHCPERTVLGIKGKDGAMAEYVTLPVENLHPVPENLLDEEAVFAEPLAAAFRVLEQAHVMPSERVLVMGDGRLGILCALALKTTMAEVHLVGKHPWKLAIASGQGVETHELRHLRAEKSFDKVVEATGSPYGIAEALGFLRAGGTILLKTTVAEAVKTDLAPAVIDEVRIIGSRCGPFAPALRAISTGQVDVRPLVTATYGFERAREAFRKASGGKALKVLIDFRDKKAGMHRAAPKGV